MNDSGGWDRGSYKQTELVSLVVVISPSVKFAYIQITNDLLTNPTQVNSKITRYKEMAQTFAPSLISSCSSFFSMLCLLCFLLSHPASLPIVCVCLDHSLRPKVHLTFSQYQSTLSSQHVSKE